MNEKYTYTIYSAPDNSQNFNRYSYCLNNPLKYTDPSGELVCEAIVIGAIVGAMSGAMSASMNEAHGWQWAGYIGVGALAGAIGAGVGSGVSSALATPISASGGGFWTGFVSNSCYATSGFCGGFVYGAAGGAAGGFIQGAGNAYISGSRGCLRQGLISGGSMALSSGLMTGLTEGFLAMDHDKSFWNGSAIKKQNVYIGIDGTMSTMITEKTYNAEYTSDKVKNGTKTNLKNNSAIQETICEDGDILYTIYVPERLDGVTGIIGNDGSAIISPNINGNKITFSTIDGFEPTYIKISGWRNYNTNSTGHFKISDLIGSKCRKTWGGWR